MTTEYWPEEELGDESIALADEHWRVLPDSFAVECGLQTLGGTFESTRLAKYLSGVIAEAVMAGGARLVINVAPRQGKSEVVSFALPIWFLEHFPQERVILATHTAALALDYARRVRNEFTQNPRLTTRMQEDAQAANQWNTDGGGGMKAVGIGGAVAGFGGKLIVVDDPHRGWVEAQSTAEREKVVKWFDGTLMRRLEPEGSVVVVMQRLHRFDLTGHLVRNSKEPWKVIRLPALARANDPMGRRIGEPVCPERYGRAEMEATRDRTSRMIYSAVYDQDPDEAKEGRTYGSYSIENVRPEPETALRTDAPVFATFDFNVNPGMHALIGQADTRGDRIIFRHEIFGERMKTPACARGVADKLKEIGGGGKFAFPRLLIYGDRSGKTENTQTAETDYALILKVLREQGISPVELRVPSANPPVKSRVAAVNDALCDRANIRHLLIHKDCKRLIRDFEDVEDGDDGLPYKGDTELTHPSDAAGYVVAQVRPIIQRSLQAGRILSAGVSAARN